MTKEEIIKEAYGDHWDLFKEHVDENGWVGGRKSGYSLVRYFDVADLEFRVYKSRPKTLKGIEYNNGWHVINTVADLPKEKGTYLFTSKKQVWITSTFDHNDVAENTYWFLRYSHWREKTYIPNPIY